MEYLEEPKILDLSSMDLDEFPLEMITSKTQQLLQLTLDFNNIETIPNNIGVLKQLQTLNISGNNLYDISENIEDLINLEELYLNENDLATLPNQLTNLHALKKISLLGNRLIELPGNFGEGLPCLEYLLLDENDLTYFPDSFCLLRNLKQLEASENQLSALPQNFGDMASLEILDLKHNAIDILPDSFQRLKSLRIVDLSHNKLLILPNRLECSDNIEKLLLENNGLEMLPPWFDNMTSLVELILTNNQLMQEPLDEAFCRSCKSLEILYIDGNHISSIPQCFGDLTKLKKIHFGSYLNELERSAFRNGNWIKFLPESFCSLTELEFLRFDENQLTELPSEIGQLSSLTYLDIGQNSIKNLPDGFCQLTKLTFIQFSKNEILALPEEFGNLTLLSELRLDNNNLKSLPDSFKNLKSLTILDLFNNDLEMFPSVLDTLDGLKRLDMDQNPFCKTMNKVPKMTATTEYPERDPNLKDNWRGKTRIDKQLIDPDTIIKVAAEDIESDEGDVEDEEKFEFNENALRRAMKRGISRWRSHGDSTTRNPQNVNSQNFPISNTAVEQMNTRNIYDDSNNQYADADEEASDAEQNQINGNVETTNNSDSDSEEDWDVEAARNEKKRAIKERMERLQNKRQNELTRAFQTSLQKYPPALEACSESGYYSSILYKSIQPKQIDNCDTTNSKSAAFDEQFEDAD